MNSVLCHPLKPMSRRRANLAACAALAVALNVAAISLFATTSSARPGVSMSRGSEPATSRTMTVVSVRDESNALIGTAAAISDDTSSNTSAPTVSKSPTASTIASRLSQPSPLPVTFYSFHEVDNPAFPESDWNVDIDLLDAAGIDRLAFEVLISERGDVVGCTVLAPTGLPDEVRRDLEKRLSATRLLPAERKGQFVASMRRIELAVSTSTPGAPIVSAAHRP